MLSFNIGPLAIPTQLAILYLGLLCAWLTGWWLGRKRKADPEPILFRLLLLGFVVARLAFVIRYHDQYNGNWAGMLDIRDGGFNPLAGVLAALAGAGWYLWRKPVLRIPLAAGLATGAVISGLGFAILHAMLSSQQLPDLSVRNLQGEPVSLHDLRGRPMVINLWATWCPPCRREMPVLADSQVANPHVTFVFANQGEGSEVIQEYLDAVGLQLGNVVLDPFSSVSQSTGSRGLPTTLFFEADGRLADVHMGELTHASLARKLERFGPVPDPASTLSDEATP